MTKIIDASHRFHVTGGFNEDYWPYLKRLKEDDVLLLKPEPDNPHDEHAIMVTDNRGNKIGYVPKEDTLIVEKLTEIDTDFSLFVLDSVKEKGEYMTYVSLSCKVPKNRLKPDGSFFAYELDHERYTKRAKIKKIIKWVLLAILAFLIYAATRN